MKFDSELFTLLNANGIDVDHIPGARPGLITREAVAAALAGGAIRKDGVIHPGASRAEMALALYTAGEDSEFSNIWAGLFRHAINTPEYKQLKERNQGKLDLLCRLAIFEFTHRPHCPHCKGSGKNADYSICGNCNGVGVKPISNTKRAGVLGKHQSSWYQFRPMYSLLLSTLQHWQDENEAKLNRRLR